MKIKAMRLSALAAVAAVVITLMGVSSAQAAATVGGLTVGPATDTTLTNFPTVTTSANCPTGATNFQVLLAPPGGVAPTGSTWPTASTGGVAGGVNVIGNTALTTATANAGGGYTSTLTVTMQSLMQQYGVTAPTGAWTLNWLCQNGTGATQYGNFVSNLSLTHGSTQASFDASYTSAPAAASSTTTLAGPASVAFGAAATYTATVSPAAATGTVNFFDGTTQIGSGTLSGGTASYTTTSLSAGSHSITAQYVGSAAYAASTSAAVATTVTQAATSVSLTGPASVQQYGTASYTATVTPGTVAGTVSFFLDNSATATATVTTSTGSAVYSTSSLSVGSHTVTASFAPSNTNYANSAMSAAVTTSVTAFTGVSAAQPITVTVPAGSLTISIAGTTGGVVPTVNLGTAVFQPNGQWFQASGALNDVTITDTRSANPGWHATGSVTDFTEAAPPAGQAAMTFSGANLGWTPALKSASANQASTGATDTAAIAIGAQVAPGMVPTGGAAASLGLSASKPFATTTAGRGDGAAVVNGALSLFIPTDRRAGVYNATLTFTVM